MNEETRKHLISLALKLVGTPYIWGGSNPNVGFDCSGFVIWVYQVFGLLPSGDWTANDFYEGNIPNGILIYDSNGWTEEDILPVDLVFYGKGFASHIGILDGLGNVISASGGNSKTLTLEDARKRNAMVKVKPVEYRNDFLCYGRLL